MLIQRNGLNFSWIKSITGKYSRTPYWKQCASIHLKRLPVSFSFQRQLISMALTWTAQWSSRSTSTICITTQKTGNCHMNSKLRDGLLKALCIWHHLAANVILCHSDPSLGAKESALASHLLKLWLNASFQSLSHKFRWNLSIQSIMSISLRMWWWSRSLSLRSNWHQSRVFDYLNY